MPGYRRIMSIRAVVWDVDDTLFDYTGADRIGMRLHLAAEGLLEAYENVEQAIVRWRAITETQWARFSAGRSTSRVSGGTGYGCSWARS